MGNKVMREHMQERFANAKVFSDNPPLPRSLNIELNNTCNHRCVFCPFHGELADHKIKLAILDVNFVKDVLKQAAELGIGKKELGFYMAGEVFLYKDFAEIVSYAKQLGFKYTFITTNGALATPDKINKILEAGIDSIRFSVNGGNRESYKEIHDADDFEKVLENIKYLHRMREERGYDVAISLSSVITKKTKSNITEIKDVFEPYVDDILFIPIILENLRDLPEVKEEWQIVEDTDEIDPDWVCAMLFNTMYINAEGFVMPCCNAYHSDAKFFDLKTDLDLKKAWYCYDYRKYRNIFLKNESDRGTACEHCLLRKAGVARLLIEDVI